MKTNKFRSWNNLTKEFIYFENGDYFDEMPTAFDWKNSEQFTGLFDRHGKEIYNGFIQREFLANGLNLDDSVILGIILLEINKSGLPYVIDIEKIFSYNIMLRKMFSSNEGFLKRFKKYNKLFVLKKYDPLDIKELLSDKNLHNKGIGSLICEWCGIKSIVTIGHHFPVLKKNGGKEIVKICSNCHNEYHTIEHRKVIINADKLFDLYVGEIK